MFKCNFLLKALNNRYILLLLLALVLVYGCEQPIATIDDAKNFKEVTQLFRTVENYFDSGRNYEIEAYLNAHLPALQPIPDTFLLKKYEYLSTHFLQDTNDFEKARLYLDSLEEKLNSLPRWDYYRLYLYFARGDLAMKEKKIQEAYGHYFKGKIYIEADGDVCKKRKYYNSLAYVQYGLNNYESALNDFILEYQSTIGCLEKGGALGVFPMVSVLNNISHCYEMLQQYDSAVSYQMLGLQYLSDSAIENSGIPNRGLRLKGVLLGNLGGSLLKLRKFNQARRYLTESIAINDLPSREPGDAILTKIKLADLYLQNFEYDSCSYLMDEVDTNLKSLPSLIASKRLANLKYRYHRMLGNFEQALFFRELDINLKDSLNKITQLTDFQPDFNKEFENLAQKVKLLTLQKERSDQQFIMSFLILGIFFASLIIIMLILRRKRIQEHVKELYDLNNQINSINHQLQFSLSFLEKSLEENERVSRIVAHDLRAPIAGILGLVNLMQMPETTRQEQNEYVQHIEQSGKNALTLIDELLQEQKNVPTLLEPVDLSGVINACIQLHKQQSIEKQIIVEAHLQTVILPLHQEKIWRLFNNLITNAIKFSKTGGKIKIAIESLEQTALVTIQDFGSGIPYDLQPHLFSVLPNGGREGSSGEKSIGLGLAISKQIVKAHNGKIWFETLENIGTTFFVELPKTQ